MINIGSIIWPKSDRLAVRLYLGFLLEVLEMLNIDFSKYEPNPIVITKEYLKETIPDSERDLAASYWWKILDDAGMIRDFHDNRALMVRLAICLLSVKDKDAAKLGEHLSWFVEVLENLGVNIDMVIDRMEKYFEFSTTTSRLK